MRSGDAARADIGSARMQRVPPRTALAPSHYSSVNRLFCPVRQATSGLLDLYRRCNPDFKYSQSIPRRCLTKPSDPAHNNDYDNQHHDYIIYVNDTLDGDHGNQYAVLDLLGTGTFGQVVKCRHQRTGEVVAVKIIKNQPAYFNQAWVEINILRMLHRNNNVEDTRHIVNFYNHFVFRGHLCLVFERLSINLYELLKQNNYVGVSLEILRNFLRQILQALNVLVSSEVIHCDLKPENILLKALDTAELKIIDFGSACQLHYPVYSYVQSRFYRSPEVLLGWTDYDSKIDMWSLGCVAGELFLGIPLFPGQNEMNMVCRIAEMLGDMPDRFLMGCRHTHKFFNSPTGEYAEGMHVFQLKPVKQYEVENKTKLPEWKRFFKEKKLKDIIMTYPYRTSEPHASEIALRESLIDLLGGMLRTDPRERWTPAEALHHPFLRGEPLPNGSPWVPPLRPRRFTRSRPLFIEAPRRDQEQPLDSIYSSSAPSFNVKARLAMNMAFGSGAGAQAPTKAFQHHAPLQGHFAGAGPYSFGYMEGAAPPPPTFAPGSYVPPPTLSMYGPPANMPMPDAPTAPRRAAGASGTSFGNASDHRPLLYPLGGVVDSPSGAMGSGDTPPLPFASTRVNSGMHTSGSRESLTGSLHMSASKESLGMGRASSVGDMEEDAIFPFGSDDEGLPPGSSSLPPGLPPGLPPKPVANSKHMGMGSGAGSPSGLRALGARLPQGRSAPYANSTGYPSYDYPYGTSSQTRNGTSQVRSLYPIITGDLQMPDMEDGPPAGRGGEGLSAFNNGAGGRNASEAKEGNEAPQQFSNRRNPRRGT